MRSGEVKLRIASPLLLHGAAGARGAPELRTASIRGMLRYWLRAALRGVGSPTEIVRKVEGGLFGTMAGSGDASRFRFVLAPEDGQFPSDQKWALLPHKGGGGEATGFAPGKLLTLRWVARPGTDDRQVAVLQSLMPVATSLGGLGLRARRGFGSLRIEPLAAFSLEDALKTLQKCLAELNPQSAEPRWEADVPVLAVARCAVLEGELPALQARGRPGSPFDGALKVVMQAFHNAHQTGGDGATLGSVGGRRRASAVHARIFADQEPPGLRVTVLRASDSETPKVRDALSSLTEELKLKPVWGNVWWSNDR